MGEILASDLDERVGLSCQPGILVRQIGEHWPTYQEEPKQYIRSENQQQSGENLSASL
jgi:hypothetical protein